METKNSKKTNGVFNENAEVLNNWVNTTSSAMNEIYKKQQNIALGFYNNMFNSMLGTGKGNYWNSPNLNFTDLFNGNGITKWFFNPLQWMKADESNLNPFGHAFENFIKQVSEYNQNMLPTIKNNFQLKQGDWVAISEKYQELVEQRWEATKNMLSALNEAYTTQMDFSIEANNKMQSELSKQMNIVLKNYEEFWNTVVKKHDSLPNEEEEKTHRTVKKEVHQHA